MLRSTNRRARREPPKRPTGVILRDWRTADEVT